MQTHSIANTPSKVIPVNKKQKASLPKSFDQFYDDLLFVLSKHKVIYTMTQHAENRVSIRERSIYVATGRSKGVYKEVPFEFISTAYEALKNSGRLSQTSLSRKLNVKRSAFIFAAFSLLGYINYTPNDNCLTTR